MAKASIEPKRLASPQADSIAPPLDSWFVLVEPAAKGVGIYEKTYFDIYREHGFGRRADIVQRAGRLPEHNAVLHADVRRLFQAVPDGE